MHARRTLSVREYYSFCELSKKFRFKFFVVSITGTEVIIKASIDILKQFGY